MADRASSFMRDWIAENVCRDPAFDGDVDARTARTVAALKDEAGKAGIDPSDPELADDLLDDEIRAAIEGTGDTATDRSRDR